MNVIKMKIEELVENPDNPRHIREDKFEKLVNSIKTFPKMLELRPIVVDESNMILGGNMRYKAAKHLGMGEVYVMRAEDLTEEQRKEFIIKDNLPYGEWDWESLANQWDSGKLQEWGLDGAWVEAPEPEEDEDGKYTKKIKSPVYEPKEANKPNSVLLFDDEKYQAMLKDINSSNIPEADKIFLRAAAKRHIVFDYQKIAEYYAHSDKEVQKLMEDSALVIIDFDRAIELGYVRLTEDMADQYKSDYDEL